MPTHDPALRLADIVENADLILTYLDGWSRDAFLGSKEKQHAVERAFQIITEAAVKLEDAYVEQWPELRLSDLRALGNFLRHDYDMVDPTTIWRFYEHYLVELRDQARRRLQEIEGGDWRET